jgi:hypothetical protein
MESEIKKELRHINICRAILSLMVGLLILKFYLLFKTPFSLAENYPVLIESLFQGIVCGGLLISATKLYIEEKQKLKECLLIKKSGF